ncbi:MAG: hypothetical protein GY851_24495, partial [bacterium]|nr:hypothetical protein [bacterium]
MKRLRNFMCWVVAGSMVLGPLGCATPSRPVPTSKQNALELALEEAEEIRADPKRMQDQLDQDLRIASMALDQGDHALARKILIEVTSLMAANLDANKQIGQANRSAASTFGEEREKYFIGDPYEQLFAYLYLGMLDIQAGDYTNAGAMFRSASLADQAAMEEGYKSDCYLAFAMEGIAARMDGDETGAEEAFRLAEIAFKFRKRMPVIQQAFYIALSHYLNDLAPVDPDNPEKKLVPERKEFDRLDQLFPTVFAQLPTSLSLDQDYEKAINGAFHAASLALEVEPEKDTPEAKFLACYSGDSIGR